MSAGVKDTDQRPNLVDSTNYEQDESKYNNNIIVDDERQTYILSNYSTLRTNLQWKDKIIQSIINKISSIKILPPSLRIDNTVASKQERVLKKELQHLTKHNQDIVESSCKAIKNHVQQGVLRDPIFSTQNNPFIESKIDFEENGIIEEEKEDIEDMDKFKTMGSLDTLVFEETRREQAEDLNNDDDDEFKFLDDPCYTMLHEQLQELAPQRIKTNDNDNGGKSKKKEKWESFKKGAKFTWQVGSRAFGLVDIVTDAWLLYFASQSPQLWYLTLSLTVSMTSPYIISYSSGVQLFLFRQTFDNVKGFKKLLMLIFLLPTGILYFLFLDLADIFMHLFRWMYFVLCCKSLQEIGQTEQILSEQLGMDRMNWEGFKRQRSIGQLMFESLPQFISQLFVFYWFWDQLAGDDLAEDFRITETQLAISIASASMNICMTCFRLRLEAKCCQTSFISYGLNCVKARVGWVPQRDRILEAATAQETKTKRIKKKKKRRKSQMEESIESGPKDEPKITTIDYQMQHRVFFYKHSVEYDFSVTTIRYLMSALQMLNSSPIDHESPLEIKFRNSLRLLPLQDIIELYDLCQKKNIKIDTMKGGTKKHQYDWASAIEISKSYGKDVRLLQYARDNQGMPYIMKLMSLSSYPDRRQIFKMLIEDDFDLNIHDLTTNESVVYTLIRSFDYTNLRYILENYAKRKGVLIRLNYHNKDGISPLGAALKLFEREFQVRNESRAPATTRMSTKDAPYLWQILVDNGAELSFPCKKNLNEDSIDGDMSPLQFVLKEIRNKELARRLIEIPYGAQLYSKEISILNDLFVNYELGEEEGWMQPEEKDNGNDDDDGKDEEKDDGWSKPAGFKEHQEDEQRDESWIGLLCDVAKQCGRPIDFITDDNGNNPIHYFINDFNKRNRHKTTSAKILNAKNALKLKRLQHLMYICNGSWTNEKNNDGDYPFQLIVKKRDPDLFFEFADLDPNFKQSIMEKKEFVEQIIDWVLVITERVTKKYPEGLSKKGKKYEDQRVAGDIDVRTLDKMFNVKYLGKLIKWPNKYVGQREGEEIALVNTAINRELIDVAYYLKDYWKFPLKRDARERLQKLEDEQEAKQLKAMERGRTTARFKSINASASPMIRGKSDNAKYRSRTSTKDQLAAAPAPVLRVKTLAPYGGLGGGDGLFGGDGIDVDMMGLVERATQVNRNQYQQGELVNHDQKSPIETIYSFIVEAISIVDFATDIAVVIALVNTIVIDKSKNNVVSWWITFMILFMIAPYFVSHSIMCALIDTRRESLRKDVKSLNNKRKCASKCGYGVINTLALFLMTPVAILWFLFVDLTFMIYLTIANIIFFGSFGKVDISDKMDDVLFRKFLGMSRMQIIGYRRLRTLSQLLFETLPQILLQVWILYTYEYRWDDNNETKVSQINLQDIYISIGVAAIHVMLELLIIYLDARASEMPVSHYAVVCLGARLNWVPFGHKIRNEKPCRGQPQSKHPNAPTLQRKYNFECIEFTPWFFKIFGNGAYRIEYEFSPSSIKKLGEYFINLPVLSSTDAPSNPYSAPVWLHYKKSLQLPIVYLGETSCRSLDVYSFAEFFRSADRKVILKSAKVDWTRIIFENTPNISSDNVYLKRLCEEFINFAEIKLITQLAPLVNFTGRDVILHILNASAHHNILLVLKKYYNENIYFGLDTEVLQNIYDLIKRNKWIYLYRGDPSYATVIFLMMWYTRRTIHRHQDPRGSLKFSDDPKRALFLSRAIDTTLPKAFRIKYSSNVINVEDKDLWNRENSDDGINKLKTMMMNGDGGRTTTHVSSNGYDPRDGGVSDPLIDDAKYGVDNDGNDGEREDSTSKYHLAPDWKEPRTQTYSVNLAVDDEDIDETFDVDFEILECFKYFQPQIERYLIKRTVGIRQNVEELIIPDKALFRFFKKVFTKEAKDFLKLILNTPWNVLQQFPVHVRFAELFSRLDPVVRRLEMVHGYAMDYDNTSTEETDQDSLLYHQHKTDDNKTVLHIHTDPAYHGHQTLRSASYNILPDVSNLNNSIQLSNRPSNKTKALQSKYKYDKADIMGIARIEIDFDGFVFQEQDINIPLDDDLGGGQGYQSMGTIELFTILPQKTKIVNGDKLMLNKVVLKSMTFEELKASNDKKLIVDLYDNEVLGMFRPIYVGRDKIELMPLKLAIKPARSSIKVTCSQIESKIIYLLRRLVDATAMKFEVQFTLFIFSS